ncbi:MAG: DUF6650 family protein [Streptosporangiaceae bacterium]
MARVRITGVSTPWLGVSWEYRESDADVVRRVFSFLEDRRVLYEPLNAQIFFYVGQSASEIRQMLTRELGAGSVGEQLSESADALQIHDQQVLALGEMRGRVNSILALLAEKYRIEVEEELAAALQSPE